MPFLERPREKFLYYGAAALTNTDLLAILLGSGTKQLPVIALSEYLLDEVGYNLNKLAGMSINDLCKIKGIGEAKALVLQAAMELANRRMNAYQKQVYLKDHLDVEQLLLPYFEGGNKLQYFLVMMNERNELLATSELSVNNDQQPPIKTIIQLCLDTGTAKICLCRNKVKISDEFIIKEEVYIKQLEAAANMLKVDFRGLIVAGNSNNVTVGI